MKFNACFGLFWVAEFAWAYHDFPIGLRWKQITMCVTLLTYCAIFTPFAYTYTCSSAPLGLANQARWVMHYSYSFLSTTIIYDDSMLTMEGV